MMRRDAIKVLNVAVLAAIFGGLVGWYHTFWPPERSALTEVRGQFVSHQFIRERKIRRDELVIRSNAHVEARVFIDSVLVPDLETLSGLNGAVSFDRSGRVYSFQVNGVERLAFEATHAAQRKRAITALLFAGLTYLAVVLILAFKLWSWLQEEPELQA